AQMVGFVFAHSGIRRRYVEHDGATPPSWVRAVNEATEALAARALAELFERETAAHACDALVVVTSSWTGFPALSRRLQERFGFRLDVRCIDLGGLGCAGPTHGLWLAHMLLGHGGCDSVCVVCVEAMGTHAACRRHRAPPSMGQLVAHCLASD